MKLMIGHVKFTLKATPEQRSDLATAAEQVGISWHGMLAIVEETVNGACEQAADAAVAEIVRHWSPEQWVDAARRWGVSCNHRSVSEGDGAGACFASDAARAEID